MISGDKAKMEIDVATNVFSRVLNIGT